MTEQEWLLIENQITKIEKGITQLQKFSLDDRFLAISIELINRQIRHIRKIYKKKLLLLYHIGCMVDIVKELRKSVESGQYNTRSLVGDKVLEFEAALEEINRIVV